MRTLPPAFRVAAAVLPLLALGCGSSHPFDRGPTATPVVTPTPSVPTPTATLAPGETPSPATPTVAPPSFADDVKPLLSPCTGCHAGTASSSWLYDGGASAYDQVLPKVNLTSPEESILLVKASGGGSHQGGTFYSTSSTSYQTILAWIEAGAPNN